ncbi:Rpn family recombination-promoting nuclease/putative transposase [Anaerolineales bacterium HSG24]|nr:Rpn family recombination-promoting nuclease/putative transposase [Anaerolineales bacterium HSG24]
MLNQNRVIRFDWAIKHILRDKANFDILEGFLSAVLREDVEVIQILESESNRDSDRLKYNRVDILVKDTKNRYLIIEIQNQHESDYLYRMLFGASKVIIDTLQIGHSYTDIAKVISISILYFNLGSGNDYVYYGATQFVGLHTKEPLTLRQQEKSEKDKIVLRQINIEKEIFPEYYLIQVERFEDVVNSPLDEWVYMLKNEEIRDEFNARNIVQARQKLSVLQMDADKKRQYERYMMDLVIERDVMETAKREARIERIKGLEEGRKEGRMEGWKEGRIETARKMLAKGYDLTEISEVTGLSLTEIEALQ